jgi:L-threonylcarbamoyladenylate synthase
MKAIPALPENIQKAAAIIREGGVIVYPTDTVYGLGCLPKIPEAAKRLCVIKGRADRPLPLACADTDAARELVDFSPVADRLAARFWPGPLMMVLPARVEFSIWVTHGSKTLGVRVPDHQVARELARLCGGSIVSTSANRSGEEPFRTAWDAAESLGKEVDLVLDAGQATGGLPSTVIDLSGESAWVLRKGPITGSQIMEALSG